jgi:hypothetical protein
MTVREQGSVMVHAEWDFDRWCPWLPVSPRGNGHARGTNKDHWCGRCRHPCGVIILRDTHVGTPQGPVLGSSSS